MSNEVTHYPLDGKALADGTLYIPVSGRDDGGEIWDGAEYVTVDNSRYHEWAEMIQNKESYLFAERKQRLLEREARIQENRRKRDEGT